MSRYKPRVSIGFPVYNGENYLHQALDSILSQTYKDFELIISDNASIDKTQEICLSYAAKDPRISYYRNQVNIGLTRNFNRAFELATGEYFAFMAHDDYRSNDLIAKCVKVLDDDPSIILCHCEVMIVDEQGKPVARYDDSLKFPNEGSPYPHERLNDLIMRLHLCIDSYGLMRTGALAGIKPLFESHYGSDRNLLAELSLVGKFYHLPEIMYFWRDEQKKYWQFNSWLNRLRTWKSWAERMDTSKPNMIPVPRWSLLRGYIRSVNRVNLSKKERLLCYLIIVEWISKNMRGLWKDLLIFGLILVHRVITFPMGILKRVRTNLFITKQAR